MAGRVGHGVEWFKRVPHGASRHGRAATARVSTSRWLQASEEKLGDEPMAEQDGEDPGMRRSPGRRIGDSADEHRATSQSILVRRPDLTVEAVGLPHPPSRNQPVDHVVYRLIVTGVRILHMGDSAPRAGEAGPIVERLHMPGQELGGARGGLRGRSLGQSPVRP